jgi:hypothetical protein
VEGDMKSILTTKDTAPSLSCKIGKIRNVLTIFKFDGNIKLKCKSQKMRSVLTILTASFILSTLSFTFNSCKDCGKKETNPASRDGKTDNTNTPSDNKTSSNTTGDGGTTNTGGNLVNTQAPAGNPINTADSGGGLASAKVLNGGSGMGGSSLPSLTSAELKALEDAVRAKIEYVLDLRGALSENNTENPFLKAFNKSFDACNHAKDSTAEKEYLDKISDMYGARIGWARKLNEEYGTHVRNDAHRNYDYRTEAENFKKQAEDLQSQAEINIAQIIKDNEDKDKDKSKPEYQKLINLWREFKAAQKKADEMWQELCDAVDADINRPNNKR